MKSPIDEQDMHLIQARDQHQMPFAEIAVRAGMPAEAVVQRITDCRRELASAGGYFTRRGLEWHDRSEAAEMIRYAEASDRLSEYR